MKKIVYINNDQTISLVTPVINTSPQLENITEDAALQRAIDLLPKEVTEYFLVDESNIPTDRTNRKAWVLSNDKKSVLIDSSKI